MRASLVLICALLLSGCPSERRAQPDLRRQPVPWAKLKNRFRPDARVTRASVKPSMALLMQYAGEVGRRVERFGPQAIAAPAKALDATVSQIPEDKEPRFNRWKQTLKQRTTALLTTKQGVKDFNEVVAACVGCHRFYAPDSLVEVGRLRIGVVPAKR